MRSSYIDARRRRGVAEIELLLIVTVFITLLMLTRGAMQLGLARLESSETAALEAYQDASANSPPAYTSDPALQMITGYSDLRPGLPNRVHVTRPEKDVTVFSGTDEPLPPFTVGAKAGFAGPAWAFSAYPAGQTDYDQHGTWFDNYVDESHVELITPLGLAPAWPP